MSDWLTYWLTKWLIDWVIDWPHDWLTNWLIDWLVDWLIYWLITSSTSSSCAMRICEQVKVAKSRPLSNDTEWFEPAAETCLWRTRTSSCAADCVAGRVRILKDSATGTSVVIGAQGHYMLPYLNFWEFSKIWCILYVENCIIRGFIILNFFVHYIFKIRLLDKR